jgi:hypothetical protein
VNTAYCMKVLSMGRQGSRSETITIIAEGHGIETTKHE